jgi:RNA polymerase sigma factor (sigma-70 family)
MEPAVNDNFIQELNEHLPIARRISRIYFPDTEDRQDAFQEMMYQLWRSYPGFDRRSKFSTWMYRVCLNTALTYRRRNVRSNESLSSSHEQIADDTSPAGKERMEELFKGIGSLSPLNKAIVLLYLESMSYDQIASITGLTKSNVSVRLVRIKKELEEKMTH